jgi:hypothetical protein
VEAAETSWRGDWLKRLEEMDVASVTAVEGGSVCSGGAEGVTGPLPVLEKLRPQNSQPVVTTVAILRGESWVLCRWRTPQVWACSLVWVRGGRGAGELITVC